MIFGILIIIGVFNTVPLLYLGFFGELFLYGYLTKWLAIQKNEDENKWFWYGFFGGLIAIIVLGLCVKHKE